MSGPTIELDIKRLYLPGVVLHAPCPRCSKVATRDFATDYLYYPTTNEPFFTSFVCEKCGDDGNGEAFDVRVILEFCLRTDEPKEEI